LSALIDELRVAMFCVDAADLTALCRTPLERIV